MSHPPHDQPTAVKLVAAKTTSGAWHEPVRTLADLLTLDSDEITEGYMDAFDGAPEPGNNRSRSYWHGWRNGACDSKRIEKDDAMAALAHDVAPRGVCKPEFSARHRRREKSA